MGLSSMDIAQNINEIQRINPVSESSYKRSVRVAGAVVLIVLFFLVSPPSHAQQDPPAPECCSRIFAAGLELGWAHAVALYSDRADNEIIDHLNLACRHIQGAHSACSRVNPAWSGYKFMIGEVWGLSGRLQKDPSRKTRKDISARIINMSKVYADSLRNQIIGGKKVHRDSCGANYFLLGFRLAYAHYAFQVAAEPDLPQKYVKRIRNNGLKRINWANRILESLARVRPVTGGCVELWREGFMKTTLKRMGNDKSLSNHQLASMTQSLWENTLTALNSGVPSLRINSCTRVTRSGVRSSAGTVLPHGPSLRGSGGPIRDYTNTSTHFSCKEKQNQEGKCCCYTGSHTYRFPKGHVKKVIARFDTGKKLNCRSTVKFEVHSGGKWVPVGIFHAVSSRGGNTNAPTDVSVSVGRIIAGFRLGDGCRCCIDSSEIWLR